MKTFKIIPKVSFILLFVLSCSTPDTKFDAKTEQKKSQRPFSQVKEGPREIIQEAPKNEGPEMIANEELSAKNKERLQEINQNLAFYCMKHRKDATFSSEESCLKFTQVVLNNCEKKHKLINTVMVNCIKERLKKRR